MRRFTYVMIAVSASMHATGADMHWPLDSWPATGLQSLGGEPKLAEGALKKCVVLDGQTAVQVTESPLKGSDVFTAAVWLNGYAVNRGQQMIMAKSRYSLNEREWGVMIDRDGRIKLYVWQGSWTIVDSGHTPKLGHWCHVLVRVTNTSADLWINGKRTESVPLRSPVAATKAPLTFGGVNDNGRIWQTVFGALEDARLYDRALSDAEAAGLYKPVASVHDVPTKVPAAPPRRGRGTHDGQVYRLWTGTPIPSDPGDVPFAAGVEHGTIHDAREAEYKFLHGAAIINFKGTFFAHWANSPENENYPSETLRGRRTTDPLGKWSELEVIGPGFRGQERHSHGVYLEHEGELWTFAARFGVGVKGRRFTGLGAEAFVLDEKTDKWESRGRVIDNCWPYDEPVRMENGCFITGGQDKDGLPVVAYTDGDNLLKWTSVLIPYPRELKPSFAETTVWAYGNDVMAVIRGGRGVAWVSVSPDYGKTWAEAQPSNLPMPRSKAYLGQLSTGQLYLVSNLKSRDTLVVSVGRPGERTLSTMFRIRHGSSKPVPRFNGHAKTPQWSYPYGYEHDGKLYVVYSVGKEDCGLSVIPVEALGARD